MNLDKAREVGSLVKDLDLVNSQLEQLDENLGKKELELKILIEGEQIKGENGESVPVDPNYKAPFIKVEDSKTMIHLIKEHTDRVKATKGKLIKMIDKFDESIH